jgi:acyl-CoA synthetase (NDP forming)/RimJ/RimL family protein N-acetyltransferase
MSTRGHVSVEVFTTDGRPASIRSVRAEDGAALRRLFDESSSDSRRMRFFSASNTAGDDYVKHVLEASADTVVALVLESGGDVVGMATAEVLDASTAEVAFMVPDAFHGRGIGTLLVEHLAAAARNRGIVRFVADVLPENTKMRGVFRDAGFDVEVHNAMGIVEVSMSTAATSGAIDAADARECAAEATSLRPLLYPRSVAVAGARREPGGIGRAVLDALLAAKFHGPIHVIHPVAEQIDGIPAVRSVAALTEPPDLIVVAVPAERVCDVVVEAAKAGTKAAVVLSSGFSEMGAAGAQAQAELSRLAHLHGIRVVGPNCLGLICNDPGVRLNATFTDVLPPSGGIAIASQSGGVGIAMVDIARRPGLGIASFVSLGNKADVSGNDLLAAWNDDPGVTAAALYLESFGNPLKFARLARRFAEHKPLLAVVGGRSDSGRRAGASHTAAAASPTVAVDALFAQAGVIRCDGITEMTQVARLLVEQPLPAANRLAIVGNAGGLGVLAADSASRRGLSVPVLSARTQKRILGHVSGTIGVTNPVDLGAGASARALTSCMETLLSSGEVDALLVVTARTGVAGSAELMKGVAQARAKHPDLPVLLVALGFDDSAPTQGLTGFDDAEAATEALSQAVAYAEWRRTPQTDAEPADPQRAIRTRLQAEASIASGATTSGWLSAPGSQALLGAYGIDGPVGMVVTNLEEAHAAATKFGFPVVAKVADPSVVHKTDRRLVRTHLADVEELDRAIRGIRAEMGSACEVLIQPEIGNGVEIALGTVRDPAFGPLVMVAAGGVATDVWKDRAFLLPPVSEQDARRALRSLRIYPLLTGFRGSDPVDLDALVQLIARLSAFVVEVPEVAEIDLNPVIATPDGVAIVDSKIRLTATSIDPL